MKQFKSIRMAGVPLAGIESADPAATIQSCLKSLNGKGDSTPFVEWNIVKGPRALNKGALDAFSMEDIDPVTLLNPTEFLSKMAECAVKKQTALEDAVIFFHMANRLIENADVCQAIWLCRDAFKAKHMTLVLLGPSITLPAELKHDVVVVSEPLPNTEELSAIIKSTADDVGVDTVKKQTAEQSEYIVDILRGLSAFGAEQVFSLSVTKEGIDMESLWDRKKKMIEQTPGLEVWRGGESFDTLGGLDNLKEFLTMVLTSGRTPVRALGFMDEIEKGIGSGAAGGDTSNTSQDQLGVLLKVMQDKSIPGIILIGHPGTGKSMIAKAAGGIANAPVISIDTGAMKGSLVGQSEQRIRAAFDVFEAVSQGKGMFIATCNKISSLPPELRRRFTLGTFFCDLPSRAERAVIWQIWMKRMGIDEPLTEEIMDLSNDWSGAEVRACCDVAYRAAIPIRRAATFVVPVIRAAPDQVTALRQLAHGRFISASKPGIYNYKPETVEQSTGGRRIQV